jgi:hypothetical protein
MYDEAKATIADPAAGAWADEGVDEPWPETERIDVPVLPPPASPPSSVEPATAPVPAARETAAARPAPVPAVDQRPRPAWWRWFTR